MLFYDETMGCVGGGDGVKDVAMSPLVGKVLATGIKGVGLAPAVISVIRGAAVAVIVTDEVSAGAGACGGDE